MLSDEERAEIEAELPAYPRKQAIAPDALKIVQRHRGGWVSDEALRDVARALDMHPAEVDSLATFYTAIYRRPVGRHVILLCDSVSCYVMGYRQIEEHLRRRLGIGFGETTPDGEFTLLPNACLGLCDRAPAMMVDGETHVDLTPEKVDAILRQCRGQGDGARDR